MFRVSSHILQRIALGISIAALLPTERLSAQEPVVASARISPRPVTRPGADSGKFLVSVRIGGVPDIGLRTLGPGQIVLVDGLGGRYTPFGYSLGPRAAQPKSWLAAFTTPSAERFGDHEYLFLVRPGLMAFEVRIEGLKPVHVVPTLTPAR